MFWKIIFMQCTTLLLLLLLFSSPSNAVAALQTKPSVIKASSTPSQNKNMRTISAGITDIVTNVIVSEGDGIQFIIRWEDDMPKDTSYNIVINTLNTTACGEPPCSVYGITKATREIVIPENATTNIEDGYECGFEFGCNYSVKVETSNAAILGYGAVAVPYCIMGICSCKHAGTLPEVISSVNIPNNETIIFNWSIKNVKALDRNEHQRTNDTNNEWKLYLVISEQTNPLLSWGGKLIPITEHIFPLKKDIMQGSFKIQLPKQLVSKAVLKLRSYIIDDLHCGGPEHFAKVTVPQFLGVQENNTDGGGSDINLVIWLNILCVLSICIVLLVATYCCWWKRYKAKKFHNGFLKHGTENVAKFPNIFEMEDNINYVDKYIEEAQEKGLADVYEIAHNKIHIGPEIGEGAFGRVYKAVAVNLRQMRGSTVVAVKQLKSNPTADEVSEFLSEIEMLKRVGLHKNIVSFLGCCTIRAPYLMIMEFVGRGDLLSYLRTVRLELANSNGGNYSLRSNSKHARTEERKIKYIELQVSSQSVDSTNETTNQHQPKSSIAETTYTIIENDEDLNEPFEYILDHKELYDFALQIANGMRFLEEQNITHRDLAARNILIDDSKCLKISDFGLSRHGIYSNTKTRKLPLRWLSIEAIRDNIYSSKSDIWAYGVVLWEIGTLGASPYPTISNHELIPYLLSGKRLEKPEISTDKLFAIMLQCWHENAEERPTFGELHQLLSSSLAAYVDITSLSDDYVFPPI